ncbi:MAG TPA: hypothetical protein VFU29_14755 [Chitinophagaceae bacterium]|nr:hypothetical protein [Chitinophagaceae bacterium]
MNKIILIVLIACWLNTNAQCEERFSSGSISFHVSIGSRNGCGIELGQQGIAKHFSFFLGANLSRTENIERQDSTVFLIYVKGLFRIYQNNNEDFSINGFLAPALLNTEFELLSGIRLLYVTGRITAVSVESSYFFDTRKFYWSTGLHFLLN